MSVSIQCQERRANPCNISLSLQTSRVDRGDATCLAIRAVDAAARNVLFVFTIVTLIVTLRVRVRVGVIQVIALVLSVLNIASCMRRVQHLEAGPRPILVEDGLYKGNLLLRRGYSTFEHEGTDKRTYSGRIYLRLRWDVGEGLNAKLVESIVGDRPQSRKDFCRGRPSRSEPIKPVVHRELAPSAGIHRGRAG